jgi:hypothetical protein
MFNWQYKLMNLTSLEVGLFKNFFEEMPYDPYVEGDFRKRRYSTIRYDHYGKYEFLPHKKFIQSSDVNDLLGDVEREYEELEEDLVFSDDFKEVVDTFVKLSGINPYITQIGVHQIRIMCSDDIKGEPAPEGRHQDGFDYIGIFCAERHNVDGGVSEIFANKDDEEPIIEKVLAEHELLIVNDREVFHNATGIQPNSDKPGYRDVFVFTA